MKECKLIATLPKLHDERAVHQILSNPLIEEVRYNSGVNELLYPKQIIEKLKKLSEIYKKKIWIDLKGRQLRINSWADPNYETVELNHEIEIEYPAKVIFRHGHEAEILHTKKNEIVLASSPEKALGKGQSINIKAKSLEIKGYLTDQDKELIRQSKKLNMNDYMASFVETIEDLISILKINPNANIISKIESLKGLEFISENNLHLPLMAARDDLYTGSGEDFKMIKILREIIEKDPKAICASKMFESLDRGRKICLHDYEDLELMYTYGYRTFMLQDDFNGPKLLKALDGWRGFINE